MLNRTLPLRHCPTLSAALFALALGCGDRSAMLTAKDAGTPPEQYPVADTPRLAPPSRAIDMIVVLGNSATMANKHAKLAAQFPKLITALEDPTSFPHLPDLRIAFLTSDVGTGSAGTCLPRFGDRGQFQIRNPVGEDCGIRPGAKWLENTPPNFSGGDLATVFGCLARGVGSDGCGFAQPLQSLNYAFIVDQSDSKGNSMGVAVKSFVRENAYLAILILTDEDDCSMPVNSLLAQPNLSTTEAWSLRCATRGHQCAGQNLDYPTSQRFVADYANCTARTDTCPANETGEKSTGCSPLANIDEIANNIKDYKRRNSGMDGKIWVAAIFGKPIEGQTTATYRIDKVPSPSPGQPDSFDYWPICYDPTKPGPLDESSAYDIEAAGLGAYGGLRIQAFLDKFPREDALGFSICETDYARAMSKFGLTLPKRMQGL